MSDILDPSDYHYVVDGGAGLHVNVISGGNAPVSRKEDLPEFIGNQNPLDFWALFESLRKGRGEAQKVCGVDHEVLPRVNLAGPDNDDDLCDDRHLLLSCPHSMSILILMAGINVVKHEVTRTCDELSPAIVLSQDYSTRIETLIAETLEYGGMINTLDSHASSLGDARRLQTGNQSQSTEALAFFNLSAETVHGMALPVLRDQIVAPCQAMNAQGLYDIKSELSPDLKTILSERSRRWRDLQVSA